MATIVVPTGGDGIRKKNRGRTGLSGKVLRGNPFCREIDRNPPALPVRIGKLPPFPVLFLNNDYPMRQAAKGRENHNRYLPLSNQIVPL